MMPVSAPRPRASLGPLVLAFAITTFQPSCATGPRLTNLSQPPCGDAMRGAVQSLLTHYESPEVAATLADRALSELQKSVPAPARVAVGGPPSQRTFDFRIEARDGACVMVLRKATLSTIASSPYPQDATVPGTPNRGSAFERVVPSCVCGP